MRKQGFRFGIFVFWNSGQKQRRKSFTACDRNNVFALPTDEILNTIGACLTPDVGRRLLAVTLEPGQLARLENLSSRQQHARLSSEETEELEMLQYEAEQISIMTSIVRRAYGEGLQPGGIPFFGEEVIDAIVASFPPDVVRRISELEISPPSSSKWTSWQTRRMRER